MNELIEQLKSRASLNDEQAKSAAGIVLEFLKQRLPAPAAAQLDSIMSGGQAGGITGALGSMFEKRTA